MYQSQNSRSEQPGWTLGATGTRMPPNDQKVCVTSSCLCKAMRLQVGLVQRQGNQVAYQIVEGLSWELHVCCNGWGSVCGYTDHALRVTYHSS